MKSFVLSPLVVLALLALIFSVSAANDQELFAYAAGVLDATSMLGHSEVSVLVHPNGGTELDINYTEKDYLSSDDVGTIGFKAWELSGAAKKIIEHYPGRFLVMKITMFGNDPSLPIGAFYCKVNQR